jgi:hypothetical protein
VGGALHQCLDGEAFTAFGTTCIDYGAAAACLHADQESVGTGTADFGRLVSAFHSGLDLASQQTKNLRKTTIGFFVMFS